MTGASTTLTGRGLRTIVESNAAETTNDPASRRKGTANPAASSSDPSGGPANWLAISWAAHSRPLAFSNCAGRTSEGINVWAQLS